ncbi:Glycosyltransferases involved in cell wall biogenesis [Candidatus Zixiibacteriota bacterium]|nr:Glycosyltransferases involved in cell wall biogenesis [candidate division Zixibacteria bacterium]
MGKKLLVILPAYNESGKIGRVVEKVKRIGMADEIAVVDDCSSDGTSEEAKAAGATVLRHEINRGVGAGIRTGIKYGIEKGYEIGAVLSGDDQHEPTEIERVVGPIARGEYDFVQGSRRLKGGRVVNDRPFRMVTTQLYSLFFSILVLKRVTDATNGFRAFRLSLFKDFDIDIDQAWLDRYELEPYILYKAIKCRKIRFREVPITIYYHGGRKQFTKMKPFRDWWRLAKPLLYLGLRLRK